MKYKILGIFLLLFLLIAGGFAYPNYENKSDTYLEIEGWCYEYPITARVYNLSDYENKVEIEDNLCDDPACRDNECMDEDNRDDDECDGCRDCEYFNEIRADVKVYNGPFESSPLLDELTTDENGSFEVTFSERGNYMIVAYPSGDYEDDYNPIGDNIEVIKCEKENTLDTKSYEFDVYTIDLYDTNVKEQDQIAIERITNAQSEGLPSIDNVNQVIKFEVFDNKSFSSFDLITTLDVSQDSETEVYKYDEVQNEWVEHESYSINVNSITIGGGEAGIFAITNKPIGSVDEQVIVEAINETQEPVDNDTLIEENIEEQEEGGFLPFSMSYIYGGIVLIVLALGSYMIFKVVAKHGNKSKKEVIEEEKDVLDKAKEYVMKYKETYSKDQIRDSLMKAGVKYDVIEKIFDEIYGL